jgi:hypothetical protein
MNEFKVNEFIILKLENKETNIYIDNELFMQCKYLLLKQAHIKEIKNIVIDFIFKSVDDQLSDLDHSSDVKNTAFILPPETEFWGLSYINYLAKRK